MDMGKVTIIGSYSAGLFFTGDALPRPGETVNGHEFFEGPGGKGSNQLIAASVMGARTRFVARVGADEYGRKALGMYEAYGISTELIRVDETAPTSVGAILIDREGRNLINIVAGANGNLSRGDINAAAPYIKDSFVVGFQLETPLDTVAYGLKTLSEAGVRTLLDPAPAAPLPDELYPYIYYLKPNEHEASLLSGIEVTGKDSARAACEWFLEKGVHTAVVTLGEQGAVIMEEGKCVHIPAPKVQTVDTTGAGDCFSGSMMARLAAGGSIENAVRFASAAAALSTTKFGVVNAIPTIEEVKKFMEANQ
jgi:ribokinase